MDFSQIFSQLFQGNNPLILILVLFLFKDQIFSIFTPKPPVVPPVPPVIPPIVVPPSPIPDRPVIDAIVTQILPVLLPLIIKLIQDQVKAEQQPKANS